MTSNEGPLQAAVGDFLSRFGWGGLAPARAMNEEEQRLCPMTC